MPLAAGLPHASRAEVAAEARARTVRHDERPQADGRGTVAQTPAGRTIGDTSPAGIGLKPDGTQLRDMEGGKLSRQTISPSPPSEDSIAGCVRSCKA